MLMLFDVIITNCYYLLLIALFSRSWILLIIVTGTSLGEFFKLPLLL